MIHQEKSNDVERFKSLAQEYWTKIYEGNSKAANQKSRAADKLVAQWNQAGQLFEILPPLLSDESVAVRCAAATFLLNFGESQEAVSILRDLALNDTTLISTTAKTVLRMHKLPL